MSAKPFLFRYSLSDAIVALCGLLNVAFLLWTFLAFPSLPWWALGLSFVVLAWAYCWNLQCISHNFIHNPFFTNVWLNRAFGVLETLCIGMPHQLYHHYHLNHHAGDNDAKGPDGTTRDWSSIYRHGKGDAPESFWRYTLLSFFRVEITPVIRVCIRHGRAHVLQTLVETAVLGRVLAGHARGQLAIFLVLLSAVFLFGLGAQLRRGIPGALRRASRAIRSPTRSVRITGSTTFCGSTTAIIRSITGTRRCTGRA